MMKAANLSALHAQRSTVQVEDFTVARRIRGAPLRAPPPTTAPTSTSSIGVTVPLQRPRL